MLQVQLAETGHVTTHSWSTRVSNTAARPSTKFFGPKRRQVYRALSKVAKNPSLDGDGTQICWSIGLGIPWTQNATTFSRANPDGRTGRHSLTLASNEASSREMKLADFNAPRGQVVRTTMLSKGGTRNNKNQHAPVAGQVLSVVRRATEVRDRVVCCTRGIPNHQRRTMFHRLPWYTGRQRKGGLCSDALLGPLRNALLADRRRWFVLTLHHQIVSAHCLKPGRKLARVPPPASSTKRRRRTKASSTAVDGASLFLE